MPPEIISEKENEPWYLEKGIEKLPVADIWSDTDPNEISSKKNLLALACAAAGFVWYRDSGVTSLSSSSNTWERTNN